MDTENNGTPMLTSEMNPDNVFRILLASDIHLGFCDDNPMREDDSFNTFEEILQIGREEKVDFVLLAGDLFHENKPKPACLQRTIEIMRKYCLGSKPVEFEYQGDPKRDFPNLDEPEVNYMNPNINIAMPVFTIHGNHDDPIGTKKTSAVDHLVAAKLINHFGQWENLNKVDIFPVPLIKGETKLALFGLGNIKDERLFRLFRDKNVKFHQPQEFKDEWFNIFVLHQNRAKHGLKNYIPESYIPGLINLAIWGHEHECRIQPEPTTALTKTWIIQPGSPVATSLCAGEAVEKFCGVLSINKQTFKLEKRKLNTVRPLLFGDIMLKDALSNLPRSFREHDRVKAMETYVETRVKSMIESSLDMLTGNEKQPTEPLIRLRVFHDKADETFNPIRFSQKFVGQVANDDIVLFKQLVAKREPNEEMDVEEMNDMIMNQDDDVDLDGHVENLVENHFIQAREKDERSSLLQVLSERGMSEAVRTCVEKDDQDALSLMIENQVDKVMQYLILKGVTEENIDEELEEFRNKRLAQPDQESAEAVELFKGRQTKKRTSSPLGSDNEEQSDRDNGEGSVVDEDEEREAAPAKGRGRGRGAARGAASSGGRGRGRGRGRGKAANQDRQDDDDDENEDVSPPPAAKSRGGRSTGRGGRGRGGTASKNLVQTTLPLTRRSPRKTNKSAVQFDDSD